MGISQILAQILTRDFAHLSAGPNGTRGEDGANAGRGRGLLRLATNPDRVRAVDTRTGASLGPGIIIDLNTESDKCNIGWSTGQITEYSLKGAIFLVAEPL